MYTICSCALAFFSILDLIVLKLHCIELFHDMHLFCDRKGDFFETGYTICSCALAVFIVTLELNLHCIMKLWSCPCCSWLLDQKLLWSFVQMMYTLHNSALVIIIVALTPPLKLLHNNCLIISMQLFHGRCTNSFEIWYRYLFRDRCWPFEVKRGESFARLLKMGSLLCLEFKHFVLENFCEANLCLKKHESWPQQVFCITCWTTLRMPNFH